METMEDYRITCKEAAENLSKASEAFMDSLVENTVKKIINEDDRINIKINSKLKKEFNIKCIKNDTTMSKVLKEFIREYIK